MEILYLDDHLVIVNKPANLLVHRSEIDRYETQFALQHVRDQLKRKVYPVHRLDKATSGALIFALNQDAARQMNQLFANGQVEKTYLAVVRGYTVEKDQIDYALLEHIDKFTKTDGSKKPAQDATTVYQRLATVELSYVIGRYNTARYSLISVQPKTGRKHQIRRHMKHVFHPIIGDTTYGEGKHNRLFRERFACDRLLLAAVQVAFVHPNSGERLAICANLDEKFINLLAALGWQQIKYI